MTDNKTPDDDYKKDWNAMVYLAGENNLAEECIYALKEMKRAMPRPSNDESQADEKDIKATVKAIDKRIKVVAQLDAGGLGGKEARYILRRNFEDHDGLLDGDVVTKIDTTETSYRVVLKDFISSSITLNGLAESYLVVLSGHGNGLISDFLSRDIETPDKLSIPKLQWVFKEVREELKTHLKEKTNGKAAAEDFKVDVLGLDSCMMSMAEIGYELRHYVNYMVGAEGFEPNTGWPYERILAEILSDPTITPRRLALTIVEKYITYYTDFLPAGRSVDQAACDLSKFDDLAKEMKKLAEVLTAGLTDPEIMRQIVLAHWEAQSYKEDQYVDIYDFCDLLDRGPKDPKNPAGSKVMRNLEVPDSIRNACKAVKKVLKDGDNPLVLTSCYSGPAVQYSNGLSLYFPWSNVIESYKDLAFANDTDWRDFLLKYIDVTRRETRRCESDPKAEITVRGELCFNPFVSGFDFLLTASNKDAPQMSKDAPQMSKVLSNKVGTMKNPAIDHVPCKCTANGSTEMKRPGDNGAALKRKGKTAKKRKYPRKR
jgi:hypothetical protein